MAEEEWHYARGNEKFGPVTFQQLFALVKNGEVRPQDLVWKPGMSDWRPAGNVAEFSEVLEQMPAETATATGNVSPLVLGYEAHGSRPLDLRYAGFWVRVGAYFIDWIIMRLMLGGLLLIMTQLANSSMYVTQPQQAQMIISSIGVAFSILAYWLYPALMISSPLQGTLGKLALKLKVTNLSGARIGFLQATAREWSKLLSALLLFIGYFMVAFDRQKRGLHDHIAGTLVVYKN